MARSYPIDSRERVVSAGLAGEGSARAFRWCASAAQLHGYERTGGEMEFIRLF